ncbi:hypothetical protein ACWEPN_08415 [Nonomuraea wenchangensis]
MGEAEWRPLPERLETGAKQEMPVPVTKTETERYLVLGQSADRGGRTVTYWRVSNAGRKADLERQAGRLVTAAASLGLAIAEGRRILVIEDAEVDDDLARDMTDTLTSFCASLYRRRSAARRAKAALRAAREAA